jgi:hypothetical protein
MPRRPTNPYKAAQEGRDQHWLTRAQARGRDLFGEDNQVNNPHLNTHTLHGPGDVLGLGVTDLQHITFKDVVCYNTLQVISDPTNPWDWSSTSEEQHRKCDWLMLLLTYMTYTLTGKSPQSDYLEPHSFTHTICNLSSLFQTNRSMRSTVDWYLFYGNRNWFVFMNTPECVKWIMIHGPKYVPKMRNILVIFLEGLAAEPGRTVELQDCVDQQLWGEYEYVEVGGQVEHSESGAIIPPAFFKAGTVMDSLLQSGMDPERLALTCVSQTTSPRDRIAAVYGPRSVEWRRRHGRTGLEHACKTIQRLPPRRGRSIEYYCRPDDSADISLQTRLRPELDNATAEDWPTGGAINLLEAECIMVCQAVGGRVIARRLLEPGEQPITYGSLHAPLRYQPRKAAKKAGLVYTQ